MTVFGFLVHYWLFTTATIACIWVLAVHALKHTGAGRVGRTLARRDDKRTEAYLKAVAQESAELPADDSDGPQKPVCSH